MVSENNREETEPLENTPRQDPEAESMEEESKEKASDEPDTESLRIQIKPLPKFSNYPQVKKFLQK